MGDIYYIYGIYIWDIYMGIYIWGIYISYIIYGIWNILYIYGIYIWAIYNMAHGNFANFDRRFRDIL